MKTLIYDGNIENIAKIVDDSKLILQKYKVKSDIVVSTLLSLEEILAKLPIEANEKVSIRYRNLLGNVQIIIRYVGKEISLNDITNIDGLEKHEKGIYNAYIEKIFSNRFSSSNKYGITTIKYLVQKSQYQMLIRTLVAILLGIIVGLGLKLIGSEAINNFVLDSILNPINTMIMNCLKMFIGPLVFLSMTTAICDFDNVKALGRIAMRVFFMYLFTSIIAVSIAVGVYFMFKIGDPSLRGMIDASATVSSAGVSISLIDTIVNIVPNNIISPFMNNDMLQIIFMGIMFGFGISLINSKAIRDGLKRLNDIISKLVTMVISLIPVIVFISISKLFISINVNALLSIASIIPVDFVALGIMSLVYVLILITNTRISPIQFAKRISSVMLTAFSTCSSSATMPVTMKCCKEKLGISSKIYSFSIPFGTTINMDGASITMTMSVLFLASVFNIHLGLREVITLMIMILLLSLSAPGVPGANLICIVVALQSLGIPSEAIAIIAAVNPIIETLTTTVNVVGDMMVTSVIAYKEDMIDLNVLNSNE